MTKTGFKTLIAVSGNFFPKGDDFGFDCNDAFSAACRVLRRPVKKTVLKVTANDEFALAA